MMKSKAPDPLFGAFTRIMNLRPQEAKKTFLMFAYFFLCISLIYILKPIRSSLFLAELGAAKLRYVYISEGIFLIFVTAAYIYYAVR